MTRGPIAAVVIGVCVALLAFLIPSGVIEGQQKWVRENLELLRTDQFNQVARQRMIERHLAAYRRLNEGYYLVAISAVVIGVGVCYAYWQATTNE